MDAPACRLCGAKHWARQPHSFQKSTGSDVPPKPQVEAPALPPPSGEQAAPRVDPNPARGASKARKATIKELQAAADAVKPKPKGKRGRPATGFDKKAYDREAARARRAAKKKAPTE